MGIISSEGRAPEGSIGSLDDCSFACKAQPGCEVFFFQSAQEELETALTGVSSEGGNATSSRGQVRPRAARGIACLLYPGNATLRETSGIGTVGHCLPGKFFFSQLNRVSNYQFLIFQNIRQMRGD